MMEVSIVLEVCFPLALGEAPCPLPIFRGYFVNSLPEMAGHLCKESGEAPVLSSQRFGDSQSLSKHTSLGHVPLTKLKQQEAKYYRTSKPWHSHT